MDEKATFRHVWLDSEEQPVFSTYLWHDKNKQTIQIFGQQAMAINSLGMQTPLQYFVYSTPTPGKSSRLHLSNHHKPPPELISGGIQPRRSSLRL